ncbi:Calmegin [Papilio machaon]|uniref:Calmegin n=1 Tax=Papilio machaon TaxID=76193 RepID=A0A0N1IQW6_PAPMA|nr:Calmegin [Papilio machaon]
MTPLQKRLSKFQPYMKIVRICPFTSAKKTFTAIVDPSATKPEDWDEEAPAQIVDPNAVKPDGWLDDAPEMIPGHY